MMALGMRVVIPHNRVPDLRSLNTNQTLDTHTEVFQPPKHMVLRGTSVVMPSELVRKMRRIFKTYVGSKGRHTLLVVAFVILRGVVSSTFTVVTLPHIASPHDPLPLIRLPSYAIWSRDR